MFKKKVHRYSILLVFLLLWLLLRYYRDKEKQSELKHIEVVQYGETISKESQAEKQEVIQTGPIFKEDDLTRISGIGPKTSHALYVAGITSYSQLAGASVEQINVILRAAGIRLSRTSDWIDQAKIIDQTAGR